MIAAAEHAQLAEHVPVGDALLARLRLGEVLAEHHQAVERDRDEEERDLVLPGEGASPAASSRRCSRR